MIKIEDIKELNFNITWRLIYKGILSNQLALDDVVKYSMEQLEEGNDRLEICELASGMCDYRVH